MAREAKPEDLRTCHFGDNVVMINKVHQANWATLCQAFQNGDVALVECTRRDNGETVVVICMVNNGVTPEFIPVALLIDGNPYEQLIPPEGTEEA
jgi:hypothetical protein